MNPHAPEQLKESTIPFAMPPSTLHRVFREAGELERLTGTPLTRLDVGEPSFAVPDEVADALTAALARGDTTYTAPEGLLELREMLVEKLAEENGIDTSPSQVFITPGSCQGLTALLQTIAEPGAEVLLPELHWPIHLRQILLAGLQPVFYPLGPSYLPDPEAIVATSTSRTKIVLLNSPANPTGAVLGQKMLQTLLDTAHRKRWQVISDEAYEHFVYEGRHLSIAALERDLPMNQRIVHSVFTFSKSMGMTGYRLGYVITANESVARAMRTVQEASLIAMSTPVQYAGIEALRQGSAIRKNYQIVRNNRDSVIPPLVDAGLLRELPHGGWYAVLNIARTGLSANDFSAALMNGNKVAVLPATEFALVPRLDARGRLESIEAAPWSQQLVRIALCVAPDALKHGVKEMLRFVAKED